MIRGILVLPKYKTAILINGCFWHGHQGCRYFVVPKSNTEFWVNKIEKNKQRDNKKIEELRSLGWKVIVIWECQLKKDVINETMADLVKEIVC